MKKAVSIIFVFILLCATLFSAAAAEAQSEFDLSLDAEKALVADVLQQFTASRLASEDVIYDDPQTVASNYIPDGAVCTDVSKIGSVVYFDYKLNNTRYIVGYHSDGAIEKTVRKMDDDNVYSVTTQSDKADSFSISDRKYTISIEENDAEKNSINLKNSGNSPSSYTSLSTAASSRKVVYPLPYTDNPSTAPFYATKYGFSNVTVDSFEGTNYNTSQACWLYKTMGYHSEVTRTAEIFSIGQALADVAAVFCVRLTTVKSWLDAAGVLFSASNTLSEACDVVDENAYTYLGGKECGIYDPTRYMDYVETYSYWDSGKISIGWYLDASGYKDPTWTHTARSKALDLSDSTVRNSGVDTYNGCISQYGYWKWEKGEFGY